MRRFIRIAVLTAFVFAAAPVLADAGNQQGECTGGLCGTPNPTPAPHSFWDDLLAWLGLD
ncbi:MAG TPA: hypothetical protein VGD80_13890 [Kofleriaceae bacterium]